MAGKDEKRVRSKTISFYVTPEENQQIQARIKIAGMPKGEYFIESLLHQKICISVGKYQSDRLSLEIKKLRIALENIKDEVEFASHNVGVKDYKTVLQEKLQKHGEVQIKYTIINEQGPDHNKTFTAQVECDGKKLAIGSGRSKKQAEMEAARKAIEILG